MPDSFFILIHDIDIGVKSDIVIFADDTRVYGGVSDKSDCDILVYKWACNNNMLFTLKFNSFYSIDAFCKLLR